MNDVLIRQIKKMEFLNGNIDIIKESKELAQESETFYNMKSEKIMRSFEDEHEENNSINHTSSSRKEKTTSERYIKSSDEMGGSSKKVIILNLNCIL